MGRMVVWVITVLVVGNGPANAFLPPMPASSLGLLRRGSSPPALLGRPPRSHRHKAVQLADKKEDAGAGGTRKRPDECTPELEVEQLLDIGMRFDGLWALVDALKASGMSTHVRRGSVVIARYDVPVLRIVKSQSYQVIDIYLQGPLQSGAAVERVSLDSLDAPWPSGHDHFTLYIKLFSSFYHEEPVICTPEEVGLVTLRDEVMDSMREAVPILGFWVSLCIVFWSYGSITNPPVLPPTSEPPPSSASTASRQVKPGSIGGKTRERGREGEGCGSSSLSYADTRRCLETSNLEDPEQSGEAEGAGDGEGGEMFRVEEVPTGTWASFFPPPF